MAGKPKLTVLHEQLRGQTFELDRDALSIGRRDGMDICLKDASMSGHHADLIRQERDGKIFYLLRDNDSTNGTKVNGIEIKEKELKNSDVIMFGSVEVLYDSGNAESSQQAVGVFAPTSVTLDLSSLDTEAADVAKLQPLNPLTQKEAKSHQLTSWALMGVGAALILAITALFVMVFWKLISID